MNPRTEVLWVVRLVTTCRPNAAQIGCAARGSRDPLDLGVRIFEREKRRLALSWHAMFYLFTGNA